MRSRKATMLQKCLQNSSLTHNNNTRIIAKTVFFHEHKPKLLSRFFFSDSLEGKVSKTWKYTGRVLLQAFSTWTCSRVRHWNDLIQNSSERASKRTLTTSESLGSFFVWGRAGNPPRNPARGLASLDWVWVRSESQESDRFDCFATQNSSNYREMIRIRQIWDMKSIRIPGNPTSNTSIAQNPRHNHHPISWVWREFVRATAKLFCFGGLSFPNVQFTNAGGSGASEKPSCVGNTPFAEVSFSRLAELQWDVVRSELEWEIQNEFGCAQSKKLPW